MRKLLNIPLIFVLLGCASQWTRTWPFYAENPKYLKLKQPKDLDECLVLLDKALRDDVKQHFKKEDSSVAVAKITDDIGENIGGLWYLNYENEKPARPEFDYSYYPTKAPAIVNQFSDFGIRDWRVRVRIIFSAYHKKLNQIKYDWSTEVATFKPYANDPKMFKVLMRKEDSTLNAYEFNRTTPGDTVTCLLSGLSPPGKYSYRYFLTAEVKAKMEPGKLINIELLKVESTNKNKSLVLYSRSVTVGDTLTDRTSRWHNRKYSYYDYYRASDWQNRTVKTGF